MQNTKKDYSQYHKNNRVKNYEQESKSFKEVLITQSILCAIIITFVLLISLINIPLTQSLRHNIVLAIENTTTIHSIRESTGNALHTVTGTINNLRDVNVTQTNLENNNLRNSNNTYNYNRVDEDILRTINERETFFGDNQKK
jgi:hypothetical protein